MDDENIRLISVTICTFNRCALLKKLLLALESQSVDYSQFEVIICDSHSTDGTDAMIREFVAQTKLSVHHVHTKNNLAAKRNIGIETAQHQLVIFLDDDCIPDTNFISGHQDFFKTIPTGTKIISCGEVRYPTQWVNKSNYYRFRDSRHFGFTPNYVLPESLDFKTIVVMNMCFEKSLFQSTVAHVDEAFIGYGAEDQDLGWRLQEHGYEILPCKALIFHFETTATITEYSSKIMRTARDGMSTLLQVNPKAAYGIGALKKLDPEMPNRNLGDKLIYSLVKFALYARLNKLFEWMLNRYDNKYIFYFPKIYRLLMGMYYVRGVNERKNRLTSEKAAVSWEG